MSEPTPFPDLKLARQQAAEWIAKMDRGLDATEIRELSQWQANVANARTLRELTTTWNDMDQLTVLADMYPRRAPAARVQRRRLWPLAVAASVLVVGCAALLALQPQAVANTGRGTVHRDQAHALRNRSGRAARRDAGRWLDAGPEHRHRGGCLAAGRCARSFAAAWRGAFHRRA